MSSRYDKNRFRYFLLAHAFEIIKGTVQICLFKAQSQFTLYLFTFQAHLIAATVRALSRLPALCSPKGALTVLPSIMWLVTGVLKESTGRGSPSADALFEGSDSSPQVAAALQSLKTLVTMVQAL